MGDIPKPSFDQELDQAAIEEILHGAIKKESEKEVSWTLRYGRKELILNYSLEIDNCFTTQIENISEVADSKQWETTLLYRAAKRLMQEAVDSLRRSKRYTLTTSNSPMKAWAKSTGQLLFQWTSVSPSREIQGNVDYETIIYPKAE